MRESFKELLIQIGQYFLEKNSNDYKKTEEELLSIGINDIFDGGSTITFVVRRPGILIGRKGTTIEGLEKYLGKKIAVIADERLCLYNWIIPYPLDLDEEF